MRTAANVARIALERCEVLIPHEDDPRNIKTLTDAAKGALETYRRARNLDEPAPPADFGPRTIRLVTPEGSEVDLGRD